MGNLPPGLAKYLAEKKAGLLPSKQAVQANSQPVAQPSAGVPGMSSVPAPSVQLMNAAPHGKRHSKVKINPHK